MDSGVREVGSGDFQVGGGFPFRRFTSAEHLAGTEDIAGVEDIASAVTIASVGLNI